MPFLRTPDVSLYFETHGEGFPLVLTHGLAGSTKLWSRQLRPLSEHFEVILWDLRGHGLSSRPISERYGLDFFANDLKILLASLGVQQAHVGGLSVGGGVSVKFALDHPAATKTLIVCDASTALPTQHTKEGLFAQAQRFGLARRSMTSLAQYTLNTSPNFCLRANEESVKQMVVAMYRQTYPDAYIKTLKALRKPSFSENDVRRLDVRTLVLAGEANGVRPQCERFHRLVEGSLYEVIGGAGHLSNLDAPQSFTTAMLNFLGVYGCSNP